MRPLRPLLAALVVAAAPLSALAAPLTVPVDQVRKLPFSGLASTVTPGNAEIADVMVLDDHTILVQGKKIGMTNLIVTDRAGRILYNDRIIVSGADVNAVMISRGAKVTAYACEPYCTAFTQGLPGASPGGR